MSWAHTITFAEPEVTARTVTFRWRVEPETTLYHRTSFELCFPESVSIDPVPMAVWWRVALVCLHSHWAFLRPCRVVLPVRLDPGERELWLRMADAEVAALEALGRRSDTARAIDLIEAGPPLARMQPVADTGAVVSCFSGGRDSLTQAALLQELGHSPVLVTTTSPREGSIEHETERRRQVMDAMQRRRNLELVEVRSDLRGCWDNGFATSRYPIGISEVTDTFLYFAAALVVGVARGAGAVYLASEAEVQESLRQAGTVVQHKHFMYSAVSQRALSAVFAPVGVRYESLTYPLYQFQVQRLLEHRYSDLRDLQYSCWSMNGGQGVCSRCDECRTVAFNLMLERVAPREIGIDLVALLDAHAEWSPSTAVADVPFPTARRVLDAQMMRCLDAITPEQVAELLDLDGVNAEVVTETVASYERMRAAALAHEVAHEPGYRAGFLELVSEPVRDRLAAIFDEHFDREPIAEHADGLQRTLTLSEWITAPLRNPELDRRRRPRPVADTVDRTTRRVRARPPAPAPLTEAELAPMRELIPGPEPVLGRRPGGGALPVAEPLLDGNEARYVSECVETGWISSTGGFVTRFEAAMAQAAGCEYAIACSSGTTALHLALAGAGIGPGDEVIVPTFTMIASPNAVGYVGAKVVLADSDAGTWNVDLDRIADAVGPRTRAIMIVHTYGHPVDADAIAELAHANDLVVIEDAAEAHGAEYHGRRAGSLGDVAGFSFYANKIIATGEGGMVTTNDPEIAAIARELRDHAFSSERHFWHRFRGFNFRMSNLQAAVGLAQVERLDDLLAARRRAAGWYREALAGIPGLELPPRQPGHNSAEWMFGILVGDDFGCSRDDLREHLAAAGIETRTFFVPIHLQPAYLAELGHRRYPVAEHLGRTGLYLPSGPRLAESDIGYVAEAIRRASPS